MFSVDSLLFYEGGPLGLTGTAVGVHAGARAGPWGFSGKLELRTKISSLACEGVGESPLNPKP